MDHAILRNSGFLKPNPYVEILVDSKAVRKTETLKNTNHPKWDQELTVLVTPASVLQFRVLDHSNFRKDTLLGEKTIHIAEILQKRDAVTDNYFLYIFLTKSSQAGGDSSSSSSPEGRGNNTGEMLVVIKGLVRLDAYPMVMNGGGSGGVSTSAVTVNGGSVIVAGGSPNIGCGGGGGGSGEVVRLRNGQCTALMSTLTLNVGNEDQGAAGASSSFGANQATNVGAIKRNSGVNWSSEAGAEPQTRMIVQVRNWGRDFKGGKEYDFDSIKSSFHQWTNGNLHESVGGASLFLVIVTGWNRKVSRLCDRISLSSLAIVGNGTKDLVQLRDINIQSRVRLRSVIFGGIPTT